MRQEQVLGNIDEGNIVRLEEIKDVGLLSEKLHTDISAVVEDKDFCAAHIEEFLHDPEVLIVRKTLSRTHIIQLLDRAFAYAEAGTETARDFLVTNANRILCSLKLSRAEQMHYITQHLLIALQDPVLAASLSEDPYPDIGMELQVLVLQLQKHLQADGLLTRLERGLMQLLHGGNPVWSSEYFDVVNFLLALDIVPVEEVTQWFEEVFIQKLLPRKLEEMDTIADAFEEYYRLMKVFDSSPIADELRRSFKEHIRPALLDFVMKAVEGEKSSAYMGEIPDFLRNTGFSETECAEIFSEPQFETTLEKALIRNISKGFLYLEESLNNYGKDISFIKENSPIVRLVGQTIENYVRQGNFHELIYQLSRKDIQEVLSMDTGRDWKQYSPFDSENIIEGLQSLSKDAIGDFMFRDLLTGKDFPVDFPALKKAIEAVPEENARFGEILIDAQFDVIEKGFGDHQFTALEHQKLLAWLCAASPLQIDKKYRLLQQLTNEDGKQAVKEAYLHYLEQSLRNADVGAFDKGLRSDIPVLLDLSRSEVYEMLPRDVLGRAIKEVFLHPDKEVSQETVIALSQPSLTQEVRVQYTEAVQQLLAEGAMETFWNLLLHQQLNRYLHIEFSEWQAAVPHEQLVAAIVWMFEHAGTTYSKGGIPTFMHFNDYCREQQLFSFFPEATTLCEHALRQAVTDQNVAAIPDLAVFLLRSSGSEIQWLEEYTSSEQVYIAELTARQVTAGKVDPFLDLMNVLFLPLLGVGRTAEVFTLTAQRPGGYGDMVGTRILKASFDDEDSRHFRSFFMRCCEKESLTDVRVQEMIELFARRYARDFEIYTKEAKDSGSLLFILLDHIENIAGASASIALQLLNRQGWKDLFGEESFRKLLEALKPLGEEARNALTHNAYDRTHRALTILASATQGPLDRKEAETLTAFIQQFGLSANEQVYTFFRQLYRHEYFEEELPEGVPFPTTDEFLQALQKLEDFLTSSDSETEITKLKSMSLAEQSLLGQVTKKSSHSHMGNGKSIDSMVEHFLKEQAQGEIAPLAADYVSGTVNIKLADTTFDASSLNEVWNSLGDEIRFALEYRQQVWEYVQKDIQQALQQELESIRNRTTTDSYRFIQQEIQKLEELLAQNVPHIQNLDTALQVLLSLPLKQLQTYKLLRWVRIVSYAKYIGRVRSEGEIFDLQHAIGSREATLDGMLQLHSFLVHSIKDHVIQPELHPDENYWSSRTVEAIRDAKKQKKRLTLPYAFEKELHAINEAAQSIQIKEKEDAASTQIHMIPDRGFMGEMSGYTGNACYTKIYPLLSQYPDLTPYKLVFENSTEPEKKLIGSVLVFEVTLENGEKALLIRAFNIPQESLYPAVNVFEVFADHLAAIAAKRGIGKVIAAGTRGSISNYPMVTSHVITAYTQGKEAVKLADKFDFNGYDLQNSCYTVREITPSQH